MLRSVTNIRTMRIGILGASFETPNLGVSALAAGSVICLLSRFPDAEVFFLDYAKEPTVRSVQVREREIKIPLVNIRFSKRLALSNNIAVLLALALLLRVAPIPALRKWLAERNESLRMICEADLFVSIAGGDSFSDIYGVERFLYVTLPQILVLFLRVPLIQLPQTYGPFRRRWTRLVAQWIVRRSERAYSRDLGSLVALMGAAETVSSDRLLFGHDVAFGIDPVAPAILDIDGISLTKREGRPLAGLNVSGLLFAGGYKGRNDFGLRCEYRDMVLEAIDLLIRQKGADVLLVPHVFGDELGSESDSVTCAEIFDRLRERYVGRLGWVRGALNQNEIKYVIGYCDFFIGSRMHACIAALSQCVPAVPIAYSDKFLGVMETIGVAGETVDARKLDNHEILTRIDQAFERRESIREMLERVMPGIRESARGLLSTIEDAPQKGENIPLAPLPVE